MFFKPFDPFPFDNDETRSKIPRSRSKITRSSRDRSDFRSRNVIVARLQVVPVHGYAFNRAYDCLTPGLVPVVYLTAPWASVNTG